MKICLFILIFLKGISIEAQELFTPPLKPLPSFKSGEILTYQIRYGFIVGGITTLSLDEIILNKKTVYHTLAIAKTKGIANTLYGVKDIYESWFDGKTILPVKQVSNIKEGHYTNYNEVTFNRRNNTVNSKLSGIHKVPGKIFDLPSTFYYLREVDFSRMTGGEVIVLNLYFGDEILPFKLRYVGKETIRTKFGNVGCLKISPVVQVGRMFKSTDDLTIWFSDDDNMLPVLVRMKIRVVGEVLLKLIKFENTVNPAIGQ